MKMKLKSKWSSFFMDDILLWKQFITFLQNENEIEIEMVVVFTDDILLWKQFITFLQNENEIERRPYLREAKKTLKTMDDDGRRWL